MFIDNTPTFIFFKIKSKMFMTAVIVVVFVVVVFVIFLVVVVVVVVVLLLINTVYVMSADCRNCESGRCSNGKCEECESGYLQEAMGLCLEREDSSCSLYSHRPATHTDFIGIFRYYSKNLEVS